MFALISPVEPVETGYRVAQVAENTFEVALPLFWIECSSDIVADKFWYNPEDEKLYPVPPQPQFYMDANNEVQFGIPPWET